MSMEALESKFIANCVYGGWSNSLATESLGVLKALRRSSRVDLSILRN